MTCFAQPAHAKSVLWSAVQPDLIEIGTTAGANRWTVHLFDPSVSIQYRIAVYASDESGAEIAQLSSGATIPSDSWVRFSFEPHKYTDVAWFGTGRAYDTPYGDWFADAAAPLASERCTPKNLYQTGDTVYGKGTGKEPDARLYAALSVSPPSKNVSVATRGTCTPVAGTSDVLCHFMHPETVSALFTFAPTVGEFYAGQWRDRRCRTSNSSMTLYAGERTSGGDYQLNVPERTIPFGLTIAGAAEIPFPPSIVAAGAACTIGQPYAISMMAADPVGAGVRYHVDWNADGAADQVLPASGFVGSGTAQSANRTYAVPGDKTIRVRAENEHAALSEWAMLSFLCAESAETAGLVGENEWTGVTGSDGGSGSSANDLTLRVLPSLVRPGNATRVHWNSQNMSGCTVSGTNGDSWDGRASAAGGETSSAIRGRVTYTLLCTAADGSTYTKSATVNVLPSWTER